MGSTLTLGVGESPNNHPEGRGRPGPCRLAEVIPGISRPEDAATARDRRPSNLPNGSPLGRTVKGCHEDPPGYGFQPARRVLVSAPVS